MNRIEALTQNRKDILSIYYTAGYPSINDTMTVLRKLSDSGVDLVEIGLPFSDPLADGPTIQASSERALKNGMSTKTLFDQLSGVRSEIEMPLIIMGYLNPILQYGIESFCKVCQEIGIDGLIVPDLPLEIYLDEYKSIFEKYGILNIFLITPQTPDARIRLIDDHSKGFIYMVSSASTTGAKGSVSEEQEAYFERIKNMNLKNKTIIGFGISNHETFEKACSNSSGAIIGSAFVKSISNGIDGIEAFISGIRK